MSSVTGMLTRTLVWLLVVIAVGLNIIRLVLNFLPDYKYELAQKIYEATELRVEIGRLKAGMRGFSPEVILLDSRVLSDIDVKQTAIGLKEVRFSFDLPEYLWRRNWLEASHVTLSGAKLSLTRSADGGVRVEGLRDDGEDRSQLLLQAGKLEVLQSEIHWRDFEQPQRLLVLQNFNGLLKNTGQQRLLHIISDLPSTMGERLRLLAKLEGDFDGLANIGGQVYLHATQLDIAQWPIGDWLPAMTDVDGRGEVQLWSEWRQSTLQQLSGVVNLADMESQAQTAAWPFAAVRSQFAWARQDQGWQLWLQDLQLQQRGSPPSSAQLAFAQIAPDEYAVSITRLELEPVAELATFLASENGDWPQGLKLAGTLRDFEAYWSDNATQFAINGRFASLNVDYQQANLEVRNFSGEVNGTRTQGIVRVASQDSQLALSQVFRAPLQIDRVAGAIEWQYSASILHLNSDNLWVDTPDFSTRGQFQLQFPDAEQPNVADMLWAFEGRSDVSQLTNIFPAKIMGAKALHWMEHAFLEGRIADGRMVFRGAFEDYPFKKGEGKFEVSFGIENGTLNFNSDWPVLNRYQAQLNFIGDSLTIDFSHAEARNVVVQHAVATLPSIEEADVLHINSRLQGDVGDVLLYLQKSPLHNKVDGMLAATESKGLADIVLNMTIPLNENPDIVRGVAHLQDARLNIKAIDLAFDHLRGDLFFSEQGLSAESLKANALGFPVQGKIADDSDATRVHVTGSTDMTHLQKQFEYLANDFAKGRISYDASVTFPAADDLPATVDLNSRLQGMTVALPEQLAKSAGEIKPLSLHLTLVEGSVLPLRLNYDDQLHAVLAIASNEQTVSAAHVVYRRGENIDGTTPSNWRLDVHRPQLNLDLWQRFFDGRWQDNGGGGFAPQFDSVSVEAGEFIWKEQALGALALEAERSDQYWRGRIDNSLMSGEFRLPVDQLQQHPSFLELKTVDLSGLSELNIAGDGEQTSLIPLINITSEQLLWNGTDLGRLVIGSEKTDSGIHFNNIQLQGEFNDIQMTGDWSRTVAGFATRFNGRLSSSNFGVFLGRLGLNDDLRETTASIRFSGGWPLAPYQFSLAELNADLQAELTGGRIDSIEPGLGRLLGLVALDQWFKRFTLDFSDIYEKGLAYNTIQGGFSVYNGKAVTDNVLLDAISARVEIKGTADLLKKTLDHRVTVIPKSSDAVPIAGTIVGGIASAVTRIFDEDYEEGYFFGSEYQVTGSWDDVKIIPLKEHDGVLKKTWDNLTEFPWAKPGGGKK